MFQKQPHGWLPTASSQRMDIMRRKDAFIALCAVWFFLAFLTGSAEAEIVAQKTGPIKSLFKSDSKQQEKDVATLSETELRAVIRAFADSYAAQITQSNIILQNRLANPRDRLAAHEMMVQSITAAYDIAVSPSSAVAILDMTVMVTLQRMAVEEFWVPKIFGDPGKDFAKTTRQLEKEIWDIAAKLLTEEQQRDLRSLINEWRKTHPDQHVVHSVRFATFREDLGKGFDDPKGLFSGVRKAADTAEELRLMGERYRYLITRMQLMLNSQVQLAYLQMVSQPEVGILLKDTNRVTASLEQFAETASQFPDNAETLVKKLGDESERFAKLVEEVKQTLVVSNEMIVLINQTIETVDSLVTRFDPIREKQQGTEPIDIADYRAAAVDFTETARQLNFVIQSLDQILSNQQSAARLDELTDAIGKVSEELTGFTDNLFYRAMVLCITLVFSILLALLIYRVVSVKWLVDRNGNPEGKT